MAASVLVQLRVPADLLGQVDAARGEATRTAWLLDAAGQALGRAGSASVPAARTASPAALGGLVAGAACPGVACSGPGCWERSTARYGLREVPLCKACAAALVGEVYQRPGGPGLRRAVSGGWAGRQ